MYYKLYNYEYVHKFDLRGKERERKGLWDYTLFTSLLLGRERHIGLPLGFN